MKKYHVKKGDRVVVNTGVFKGEEATVTAILSKKDRVVLTLAKPGAAANLGKRTVRKSQANPNGGLTERAVSVHVSNVNKKSQE